MIIPINDKYRIKSDSMCWHIQQWRPFSAKKRLQADETGEWHSFSYHSTLENCVRVVAEVMIMKLDTKTVEEALKGVREVLKEVNAALQEIGQLKVSVG